MDYVVENLSRNVIKLVFIVTRIVSNMVQCLPTILKLFTATSVEPRYRNKLQVIRIDPSRYGAFWIHVMINLVCVNMEYVFAVPGVVKYYTY